MILFASTDAIRHEQQRIARLKKGEAIPAETARREAIDDARELRAHARAREFAYLLFVFPVLVAIASALVSFVMSLILKG
jgi:hypothetical protein